MPVTDLAALAQIRSWLPNAPASSDDVLLASLITSSSTSILSYLERQTLLSQSATERYSGYGECRKMLRRWPVTSVASVLIGQTNVPVQPSGNLNGCGSVFDAWDGYLPGRPQLIDLIGYSFCWGQQNCAITYTAGYLATDAVVVPTGGGTSQAAALNGPWVQDGGVVYASSGIALTKVNVAPTIGQYQVSASGLYTYSSGDQNVALLQSYSFVPQPLNQFCIEMTAEAYRYRTRIGERSHTTPGPQTTFYDLSRMTAAQKMMLDPFKMIVPLI